jgi:hypothetical protein
MTGHADGEPNRSGERGAGRADGRGPGWVSDWGARYGRSIEEQDDGWTRIRSGVRGVVGQDRREA